MLLNIKKYKKGTALYLVIVIVAILLPLGLGLSVIVLGQIKMTREMGYSVVALYAADAGLEEALMGWRDRDLDILLGPPPPCLVGFCPLGGAEYHINVYNGSATGGGGTPLCDLHSVGLYYCIKAVGRYQEVHRSIEVNL
jgi:hypothetical protein